MIEEDKIVYKHNKRFRSFCLKRKNTRRMNQTSLPLLQSWRANVDVKILIYDHDPRFIDSEDIANVVNYIVSYISKGNQSFTAEKDIITDVILK